MPARPLALEDVELCIAGFARHRWENLTFKTPSDQNKKTGKAETWRETTSDCVNFGFEVFASR